VLAISGLGQGGLPTSMTVPSQHLGHLVLVAGMRAKVALHLVHLNLWSVSSLPVSLLTREILRTVSTKSA
jgi:hypothetical protein